MHHTHSLISVYTVIRWAEHVTRIRAIACKVSVETSEKNKSLERHGPRPRQEDNIKEEMCGGAE